MAATASVWLSRGVALASLLVVAVVVTGPRWSLPGAHSLLALSPAEISPPEEQLSSEEVVHLHVVAATDRQGVSARSYGGSFPGPTIRTWPGRRLSIRVTNELEGPSLEAAANSLGRPNATSLHVHGLHVSPEEDDVFSVVGPGSNKTYVYELPKDHPEGTFYYHAHLRGSSSLQVGGGMSGALIVGDSQPGDVILVLQETNLVEGGARNYAVASRLSGSRMPLPDVEESPLNEAFVTVNGLLRPTLRVKGRQRWRLINAAATDVVCLRLPPGCRSRTLARDGVSFLSPRRESIVVLAPGSRADLAVACVGRGNVISDPDGIDYLGTATKARGVLFGVVGDEGFADLGGPDRPVSERLFASLLDLSPAQPPFVFEWSQWRAKVARSNGVWTWYGVNGRDYAATPGRVIQLGAVEEWLLRAPSNLTDSHPFHLHTHHFQIVQSSTPTDARPGDWRDTVPVPAGGNLTIRFRPLDFAPATSLAHCHVFSHADLGMDMLYRVEP